VSDSLPRPSAIDDVPAATNRADPIGLLRTAEALHEEGRLDEAWEIAEAARAGFAGSDPIAHTETLYLLACIAKDQGSPHAGQERIARAIAERAELTKGAVPLAWYEMHAALAQASGEHTTALTAWESAAATARTVREETGQGTERLCLALRALGDSYLARGQTERALAAFSELVKEARSLVAASADMASFRHLTSALQRLGDACQAANDQPGALGAYRDAVREAKRAAAASGDAPEALWDLSVGLNRLGGAQLDAEQAQAAIASFEHAVDARRTFCDVTGRTPQALSALASSLSKLGGALAREGEDAAAAEAIEEAAALDREAALGDNHQVHTLVPPPIAR
jgi:tetratricopeptide (TPR) repeat protein